MDKALKSSNPGCWRPSWEPFRIYVFGSCWSILRRTYSRNFVFSVTHRSRDFGSPDAGNKRVRATLRRVSHTVTRLQLIVYLTWEELCRPSWLLCSVGNRFGYVVTHPVLIVCLYHALITCGSVLICPEKACLWQSLLYTILILYVVIRFEILASFSKSSISATRNKIICLFGYVFVCIFYFRVNTGKSVLLYICRILPHDRIRIYI
jgi:hypothetical protein